MDFKQFKTELNGIWESRIQEYDNYDFIKGIEKLHKSSKSKLQIGGNLFGESIYYKFEIKNKFKVLYKLCENHINIKKEVPIILFTTGIANTFLITDLLTINSTQVLITNKNIFFYDISETLKNQIERNKMSLSEIKIFQMKKNIMMNTLEISVNGIKRIKLEITSDLFNKEKKSLEKIFNTIVDSDFTTEKKKDTSTSVKDNFRLKEEVKKYLEKGYVVENDTMGMIQLKKYKKKFSLFWLFFWGIITIFIGGLGSLVYIIYHFMKKSGNIILEADENGTVRGTKCKNIG
jgi:hypothetical protein